MVRWFVLAGALALAIPTVACSKGAECDTCSGDSDCDSGMFCRNFLDDNGQSVGKRCGSGQGVTTCRVR